METTPTTPMPAVAEGKERETKSADIGSGDGPGPLMGDTGNSVTHEDVEEATVTPSRNWMKDSFAERSSSVSQLRQAELLSAITVAEKVSVIELISKPDLDILGLSGNSRSKLYNSEDEGESSISICTDPSNTTSEDELTRKQRLSVLKTIQECDKFMDQLAKASRDPSYGMGDKVSPALGQGDVKLEKVFKSIEDLEAMYKTSGHNKSNSSLLVQTSEMSEVTSPTMTSQTRMAADLITDKGSPSKASELNAWVEKGTWMKSTESVAEKNKIKFEDTCLDFKHVFANSSSDPNISGACVQQFSESPMRTSGNDDHVLGKVSEMNATPTDTEEYLNGAPEEFAIDNEYDNDEGGRKCFKCLIA